MQHRYVPDVGDFGKFGLIAALAAGDAGGEALSVRLVWYLTEPELDLAGNPANRDGRHVNDLRLAATRAGRYRDCAPSLYDHLAAILADGLRDVKRLLGAWGPGRCGPRRLGPAVRTSSRCDCTARPTHIP